MVAEGEVRGGNGRELLRKESVTGLRWGGGMGLG